MEKGASLTVCVAYALFSSAIVAMTAAAPAALLRPDFATAGLALFALGTAGNAYHHWLLAQLRAGVGAAGAKKYVAPRGGLFGLIVAPHYLFEARAARISALSLCISLCCAAAGD